MAGPRPIRIAATLTRDPRFGVVAERTGFTAVLRTAWVTAGLRPALPTAEGPSTVDGTPTAVGLTYRRASRGVPYRRGSAFGGRVGGRLEPVPENSALVAERTGFEPVVEV